MHEMTGVRLFKEEEAILNHNQCKQLRENVTSSIEKRDCVISEKHICEVYFSSSVAEEAQAEQFLITIEQKGKKKTIKLKRKSYYGGYGSETAVKLSIEQYRSILQGSLEWMKESSKILCNEFYCKIKLFQYRISKIVKCCREEIYLKYEQLHITIDENINVFSQGTALTKRAGNLQQARVCIRNRQGRVRSFEERNLISQLLK